MGQITEDIRRVLERSATGALPLSAIKTELRREGVFLDPADPWVLSTLKENSDTFRIITLPKGPWTNQEVLGPEGRIQDGSWLLLTRNPEQDTGPAGKARAMIREGFRAWASGMDPGSPRQVARWMRANLEGARVCRALVTGGNQAVAPL